MPVQKAKFSIGDIVKHKHFEFRGVIYDVDFEFNNSEEWYQSIPKNVRPRKKNIHLLFSISHPMSDKGIDLPIIFLRIGSLVKYFPKNNARANIMLMIVGLT